MLKNIPKIIGPDLLKALAELGHGDRLAIVDANFPAKTMSKNSCLIRMDGHNSTDVLEAVLTLIPLDQYVAESAFLMEKVPGDKVETPVWDEYEEILISQGYDASVLASFERSEFYEQSKKCALIIATGEEALYGNIILQKGVL